MDVGYLEWIPQIDIRRGKHARAMRLFIQDINKNRKKLRDTEEPDQAPEKSERPKPQKRRRAVATPQNADEAQEPEQADAGNPTAPKRRVRQKASAWLYTCFLLILDLYWGNGQWVGYNIYTSYIILYNCTSCLVHNHFA